MTAPVSLIHLFNAIVEGGNATWTGFDLYAITLFGGGVLRYTTAPFDIAWNGNSYASAGTRIDDGDSKAQAHWKLGLDTDTWQVLFKPRAADPVTGAAFPDQINGQPWLAAASAGALDSADFVVRRAYFAAMPTYPTPPGGAIPVGARTIFAGLVAALDISTTDCAITANDYRQLLTVQMPRNVYQGMCRHMLFDAGCGLNAATFQQTGTAQTGSNQKQIVTSLSPPGGSSGTFALGRILMTSGNNTGFQRTIRAVNGGSLALYQPLPFAVAIGDSFHLWPGCSKHTGHCNAYGNIANFGGFPYIPNPETAA